MLYAPLERDLTTWPEASEESSAAPRFSNVGKSVERLDDDDELAGAAAVGGGDVADTEACNTTQRTEH